MPSEDTWRVKEKEAILEWIFFEKLQKERKEEELQKIFIFFRWKGL